MDAAKYKIALTLIPKVGAKTARQLVSYCGSAEAVFRQSTGALQKIPGIGPQIAAAIRNGEVLERAEAEVSLLKALDITPHWYLDTSYPQRLKQYPDSPVVLYQAGDQDLNAERFIAVVGTRKPTPRGLAYCEYLIEQIREYRPVILSGLAYGIDSCAHRKALDLGLPTIAVLAHGLKYVYPADHHHLAARIRRQGGLLSEYPFHTKAEKEFFPMRNRIVAGMCDAVIVVETAERGGSMITAQLANEYFKDVFAVPGRVHDPSSSGCNLLIKTHRAALLDTPEDLVRTLNWDQQPQPTAVQTSLFQELTPEEKNIVALLQNTDPVSIDQITFQLQLPNSAVASLMLELEFKGLIRTLPGSRFILTT